MSLADLRVGLFSLRPECTCSSRGSRPAASSSLPDRVERPPLVQNAEPDWLKDDLRPPAAGPLEMGDTAAR